MGARQVSKAFKTPQVGRGRLKETVPSDWFKPVMPAVVLRSHLVPFSERQRFD
jgi:hypothetical protein